MFYALGNSGGATNKNRTLKASSRNVGDCVGGKSIGAAKEDGRILGKRKRTDGQRVSVVKPGSYDQGIGSSALLTHALGNCKTRL